MDVNNRVVAFNVWKRHAHTGNHFVKKSDDTHKENEVCENKEGRSF